MIPVIILIFKHPQMDHLLRVKNLVESSEYSLGLAQVGSQNHYFQLDPLRASLVVYI